MASQLTNQLIAAIDPALKNHGFKRKGQLWSKKREDLDLFVCVQKGWAGRYYIEFGMQRPSKQLWPSPGHPAKCPIRARIPEDLVADRQVAEEALRFSEVNDMEDGTTARKLLAVRGVIEAELMTSFCSIETLENAKKFATAPHRSFFNLKISAEDYFAGPTASDPGEPPKMPKQAARRAKRKSS